jgi:hypothetical protein
MESNLERYNSHMGLMNPEHIEEFNSALIGTMSTMVSQEQFRNALQSAFQLTEQLG